MKASTTKMKAEFNSLIDLMLKFPDDLTARKHYEKVRWNDVPVCPYCACANAYRYNDGKRFKCRDCQTQFTVKTGTIFEGSNIPMNKWFIAIYLFFSHKKGESSYQLAKDLNLTQKTAWFMTHRLRHAVESKSFEVAVNGIAQVDETWVGGLEGNKHWNKRTKGTQGKGSAKTKTMVAGIRNEEGKVIAQVMKPTNENMQDFVYENVEFGSAVMTDENKAYSKMGANYFHKTVCHGKGEFAIGENNEITVNGVENYWSHLKRMIMGTYHQISPKHLNKYVCAQSFRYNNRGLSEPEKFKLALDSSNQKRLTYKALIAKVA